MKLINILKEIAEAKQVGNVYHFTTLENWENIKKQGIKFGKDNLSSFNPKYKNILYSISVTRDKSGDTPSAWGKAEMRITLDGDKISNKYKIIPINASNIWQPQISDYSKEEGWAEERIISNNPGYLSTEYIIDVEELDDDLNFFD